MAVSDICGTKFSFSVLPLKLFSNGYWARTEIKIENEYVKYAEIGENLSRDELDAWITAMFRLLAGAYAKEYALSFENKGFAVELYPYTKDGEEATRTERRENECTMSIHILMRSSDRTQLLGGVYSLIFHKKEIEKFASELRREFDQIFAGRIHGRGKYAFVGVSPWGYRGCNYWYLDTSGKIQAGDYVWVRMGRHKIEQIVRVDMVKRCNDDTAPYDPQTVQRVLKKATDEEVEKWSKE